MESAFVDTLWVQFSAKVDSNHRWLLESLLRRLGYAATVARDGACAEDDILPWDRWRDALVACSDAGELRRWIANLEAEFRRLRRKGPLTEYLASALDSVESARLLVLTDADLQPSSESPLQLEPELAIQMRFVLPTARQRTLEWMNEARVAWASWAPRLDRGLFQVQFDGEWCRERPAQNVKDALVASIVHSPGRTLVSWDYEDVIALVPTDVVRGKLQELAEAGFASDMLILPIEPQPAVWAISYFHHDWLELGQLKSVWPHRVTIG